MSVAGISGLQVFDPPLRPLQAAVDQEGVGVGADLLRRDPGDEPHQCRRQQLPSRKPLFKLAKAILICCLLPFCRERSVTSSTSVPASTFSNASLR